MFRARPRPFRPPVRPALLTTGRGTPRPYAKGRAAPDAVPVETGRRLPIRTEDENVTRDLVRDGGVGRVAVTVGQVVARLYPAPRPQVVRHIGHTAPETKVTVSANDDAGLRGLVDGVGLVGPEVARLVLGLQGHNISGDVGGTLHAPPRRGRHVQGPPIAALVDGEAGEVFLVTPSVPYNLFGLSYLVLALWGTPQREKTPIRGYRRVKKRSVRARRSKSAPRSKSL